VSDGEQAQSPQLVANGSALLFAISKSTDGPNRWDKGQIVLQTMKSGTRKTLVAAGSDPRYLPTGHLIYALGGIEFAVAFDPVRQEVMGAARAGSSGRAPNERRWDRRRGSPTQYVAHRDADVSSGSR
jgi:hypothetical protein